MEIAKKVASLIQSKQCNKLAFLTGAGVSVSAGIPDFRSPGGMYDTLRPELLTASPRDQEAMRHEPTLVVNKSLFFRNQFPYLEVRRPFILGIAEKKWKATLSHAFFRICNDRGLLVRVYTQNIDGLDFQVGVPMEKLVPVHGTMGKIMCEACGHVLDEGQVEPFAKVVKENIKDIYNMDKDAPKESTNIPCPKCGKHTVKPATVLYGGSLPDDFFKATSTDFKEDPGAVDLVVVMGTSLQVHPAALVPEMADEAAYRLLINNEGAGTFGSRKEKDLFMKGECDESVLILLEQLGWLKDLEPLRGILAEKSVALLDQYVAKKEGKSAH